MQKGKKVKVDDKVVGRLSIGIEAVLVIIVLIVVSQFLPFEKEPKLVDVVQKTDSENISVHDMRGDITADGDHFTPIEMVVIGSTTLDEKVVKQFPDLPGDIKVFDKSKFIESEVNIYEGGREYFLTFEYPGMTDSAAFKRFYEGFAAENGWQVNLTITAVNGIKTVIQKDNIEMRVVTVKKINNDTGVQFVREKVRVLEAK